VAKMFVFQFSYESELHVNSTTDGDDSSTRSKYCANVQAD
jgi:hypothetical protein